MSFKYTKGSKVLSEEQRIFYEKNGYLLFRNLVDHQLLDECKQIFIDICEGRDSGPLIIMKETSLRNTDKKGELLINKIQDFLSHDGLFKYVAYKAVADIVEDIIGPNITAVHSMLINKPPDSSPETSKHPLHQDLHYFPFRPINTIVASWTAMERVDETNGCLFVLPGTHKLMLFRHEYPGGQTNFVYHGVKGFDHIPKMNIIMEKGDTVFFHPLLLHGSGSNFSKGFRKAISCHYADTNSYFIDVKGTTQESIEKEVQELLAKRGVNISYVDFWKSKSRLVRGQPGNFQNANSRL